MTWGSPWAWLLAAAVGLPLVAHLWSRRSPPAVPFPTLQFLERVSPVALRLRTLQDPWLLLLRVAIVVAVAAAAARPALPGPGARPARTPLHRVIVVDRDVEAAGTARLTALRGEVTSSEVVGPGPVRDLLEPAVQRARIRAESERVEIVVLWDGTHRVLVPGDLAAIPPELGVRLEAVRGGMQPGPILPVRHVTIDTATEDDWIRKQVLTRLQDMRLPHVAAPVHLALPAASPAPVSAAVPTSMRSGRVLDDVASDVRLVDAAERSARDPRATARVSERDRRWLARTRAGESLLRGVAGASALRIESDALPTSPVTWWAVVAALESQVAWERRSMPPHVWTPSALSAISRDAQVGVDPGRRGDIETRLAWTTVLALLLVEQWWRRRPTGEPVPTAASADAAEVSRAS